MIALHRPEPVDDVEVIEGDSLQVLPTLPTASFDAVITDAPYSSGGLHASDRAADPAKKYCQNGNSLGRPTFTGDNRDQRSWAFWCTLWMSECLRLVKPGGYGLFFTDWRQLPSTTDAMQAAGWIWRGVIAWDKTEGSRAPHKGYFRHQCEYVAWGSHGAIAVPPITDPRNGPWPGCYRHGVRRADKFHMTGKPTELMRHLVQVVPPGGRILDPFAGSGTTPVAAKLEGRGCVAIEKEPAYAAIARGRLAEAVEARAAA